MAPKDFFWGRMTAEEARGAGWSWVELKRVGYSCRDAVAAGLGLQELRRGVCTPEGVGSLCGVSSVSESLHDSSLPTPPS